MLGDFLLAWSFPFPVGCCLECSVVLPSELIPDSLVSSFRRPSSHVTLNLQLIKRKTVHRANSPLSPLSELKGAGWAGKDTQRRLVT
jgi:hypothetical protein